MSCSSVEETDKQIFNNIKGCIFEKKYIKDIKNTYENPDYYLIGNIKNEQKSDYVIELPDNDYVVTEIDEFLECRTNIKRSSVLFNVEKDDNNNIIEYKNYINDSVDVNEPVFDYKECTYFTEQQKKSIEEIENMEYDNFMHVESEFFDENVINTFAISSNLGMLSNNVGSGKTRIAVAVAFRNLYSQKNTGTTNYKLPINFYCEEIIKDNDNSTPANTQSFRNFFGSNSFKYNPITEYNVRNLGDKLEKNYTYKCIDSTLIVVSPSTFFQWEKEIYDMQENFNTNLKILTIPYEEAFTTKDPIDDKDYHTKTQKIKQRFEEILSNTYNIILVTNEWFNDILIFSKYFLSFNRVFYDEPDTIEYKSSVKVISRFNWLISTTIKHWIMSRYTDIKGTEELAGRGKAERIGEVEMCMYDDPSIVEIMLDNFIVRKEKTSDDDNTKYLEFIKYKDFSDCNYKDFDSSIFEDNTSISDALSSYDIKEIERFLGTEKVCIIDKIYTYINSYYPDDSDLSTQIKVFEAKGNVMKKKFGARSKDYLDFEKKSKNDIELTKSNIAKKNDILKKLDNIILNVFKRSKEDVYYSSLKNFYISDCCLNIVKKTDIDNKDNIGGGNNVTKKVLRRTKTVKDDNTESESNNDSPDENFKMNLTETDIFKEIIKSCNKTFSMETGSITENEGDKKSETRVNLHEIFNIQRSIEPEKYSNCVDKFSIDVKKYDCNVCGLKNCSIFNLEDTEFVKRLGNFKFNKNNMVYNTDTRKSKLLEILDSEHKFIIFATNGSNIPILLENKVKFNVVQGDSNNRKKLIKEYHDNKTNILVLINNENSAGLNLTDTTDLIIMNQTSNIITEQIIGRVDRIGLDHNVRVHFFDISDSMEQFIKDKYNKEVTLCK